MKVGKWNLALILCVIFTFTINHFIPSSIIETYYQNGLFQLIRLLYRYTLYYLPFAFTYILFLGVFYLLYIGINKNYKWLNSDEYLKVLFSILKLLSILYVGFYWLWGFNYKTREISERLNLKIEETDTIILQRKILKLNEYLEDKRNQLSADTSRLSISLRPNDLEGLIRKEEESILPKWGYYADKEVKVRPFYPKGFLLVWSTAGIYNPFSLEGNYDPGLSHLQIPFVIAHELGHAYAITSESDCNFLAVLACANSKDKYINYTGMLTYWRYLMNNLKVKAPYSFYKIAYHRPLGLRSDIKAIYEEGDKYPDILPKVREFIYDRFLKINGIEDGMDNYNRVVDMVFAYEKNIRKEILK